MTTGENECDFEGCDRTKKARGLCLTHYKQWQKGKPLTPIHTYNRTTHKGKVCSGCGEFKPRSAYYRANKTLNEKTLVGRCIECYSKDRRAATEARRALRGEKKYRLGELVNE